MACVPRPNATTLTVGMALQEQELGYADVDVYTEKHTRWLCEALGIRRVTHSYQVLKFS